MSKRVRITANGKTNGTSVVDAETGEPLRAVRVEFQHGVHDIPRATVVTLDVEAELECEAEIIARSEYRSDEDVTSLRDTLARKVKLAQWSSVAMCTMFGIKPEAFASLVERGIIPVTSEHRDMLYFDAACVMRALVQHAMSTHA